MPHDTTNPFAPLDLFVIPEGNLLLSFSRSHRVKIYRSPAELPANFGPTVATIGNFDGVHRGHQWVIAEVIARAQSLSAPAPPAPNPKESPSPEEPPTVKEASPTKKSLPTKEPQPTTEPLPATEPPPTQEASSRPEQRTALSSAAEWTHTRISLSLPGQVTSLAITLDPHPARVLGKQTNLTLITPLEEKLSLLAATGINAALILPFDLALSHLTARDFATKVLRDAAHVVEVHEGENFRFGHHAEAGTDGLAQLGRELGFEVKTYTPRSLRGEAVSSSRIRKLIAAGDVSHARALLGRPFTILSAPAPGRGYGTKYTVPTINLASYAELLPANGVYITTIVIGEAGNEETFEAVTNVGNRPTFGHIPGTPDHTVESHLLNFHPIALDESTPIRLAFLRFLRPEIKWPNPEALRAQIGLDVARARRYFSLCKLAHKYREPRI